MSSWQQHLVNAQTSVNRAQFEVHRPEIESLPMSERHPVRFDYLGGCCDAAIKDLQEVLNYCRARIARDNLTGANR